MNTSFFRTITVSTVSIVTTCSLVYALWVYCESGTQVSKSILSTHLTSANPAPMKTNPVVYFEIPVLDMERAMRFYSIVFETDFTCEKIDGNEMALFPLGKEGSGISGALAKGEIYKPTKDGVVIYFKTENIDETIKLAISNGGQILYPKIDNGIGLVAEFEDTEGNRVALYQSK